jgi:LmbE family N-acetylglucosaminyl deacetylase
MVGVRVSAKAIGLLVTSAVLALACAAALLLADAGRALAAGPCVGGDLYVAAHEDDTLLFQSPALLKDIQAGHCVQTVFLTAGDSGRPASYWEGRETGAEVAYAQMADAEGAKWKVTQEPINGHPIQFATLPGKPISIAYLRLPDGGVNGEGFPLYGEQSLMRLWDGANPPGEGETTITSIEAVDDSTNYSYEDLIATLRALIESFAPSEIATQNYTVKFKGPDHADHVATGKFVKAAQNTYGAAHLLTAFEDYETAAKPENVEAGPLAVKSAVFYAYGAHDDEACSSEVKCTGTDYAKWLERQYVAAKESVPGAIAGSNQTVVPSAAVQLNGSGSFDPGNDLPLTYAWVQTGGPKVTLSSATSASPTFTAPSSPTTLVFSLKVKNKGNRESLASSVTVNVENPPPNGGGGGGGGGGNPPPPKENIVVKLSKAKVKLVVGKQSKHLVKVIAPGKSAVKCRGQLPKGARCRVNAQRNVIIESSKSVKRAGTYHLVIHFSWQFGADQRPLTVVFKPSGR